MECDPGRSESASSSSFKYSKPSSRPADGCNKEGSNAGVLRKEETSAAVLGSKGVGTKTSCGSTLAPDGEAEVVVLRPVMESHHDMAIIVDRRRMAKRGGGKLEGAIR